MKKYYLFVFVVLGTADMIYGFVKPDRLSVLIGAIIAFVALAVFYKRVKAEKED